MICPHCGALLLDNAKFCESCGGVQPDYEQRMKKAAEVSAAAESIQPAAARPLMTDMPSGSPSYTGFKGAVSLYFSNFTNFRGRSTILEFWYGALFYVLASTLATLLFSNFGLISSLLSLVLFLPFLSLSVRRLHDVGKSGWWAGGTLLCMIAGVMIFPIFMLGAVVGFAMLLHWFMKLGDPGENKWGKSAEMSV